MDVEQLKKYLAILVELEKDKHTQKTMIAELEEEITAYQKQYDENQIIIQSWNHAPTTVDKSQIEIDKSGKGILILSIYVLCAISGTLAWVFASIITKSQTFAIIPGVTAVLLCILLGRVIWKSILNKRIRQELAKRQRQLRVNNNKGQKISGNALQTNQHISSVIPQIKEKQTILHNMLQLTQQTLSQYYSADIIPQKYRSLIPVCMFYDYITNGRTYSIQRDPSRFDEGAINIYEQERLQKIIISKLDDVIDSIEDLTNTQRVLCDVIQKSNRDIQRILHDINDNIKASNDSLQIIQYQNEQRNRCLAYANYMESRQLFTS